VALRQLALLPTFLNCKPPRPIRALQVLESVDWNTARSRGELQQTTLLLCVQRSNALPEVLDDSIGLRVPTVVRMFLPVVDINVCYTTDEQLQFTLVEDVDQVGWDELMESSNEGVELLFDALLNAPFSDEPASNSSALRFGQVRW